MCKCGITKWIILITLAVVGLLVWKTMPEHKRIFWRNLAKQVRDLPARYMV